MEGRAAIWAMWKENFYQCFKTTFLVCFKYFGMASHFLINFDYSLFFLKNYKFNFKSKIDRNKTNTISKQEFRAAIESHFEIELTDLEFEEFFRSIPKDNMNRIKYLEFMTRFDTDSAASLYDSQSVVWVVL